ncbi:MAG: hypothetical protein HY929_09270 [Euryarchaeota archaeon]|nr:hypothetical protein [Euryarchaeota archaeon]
MAKFGGRVATPHLSDKINGENVERYSEHYALKGFELEAIYGLGAAESNHRF